MKTAGYFFSVLFLGLQVLSSPVLAQDEMPTDETQRIYKSYGAAVYQVQVIDLASAKKAAIGSGFQFTTDGYLATNYHVVAEAIRRPAANRLEYLRENGQRGALRVVAADIVRDLAILKMDVAGPQHVHLGTSNLPKGARMFSLGNPHDIGFTIVDGINNGSATDSFIDKIHFSGAINAGMSGGPVLDHAGAVVGVNVMTGGNQIGFLVPVEPLHDLFAKIKDKPVDDFYAQADSVLEEQLIQLQDKNIQALLQEKAWDSVAFGPIVTPARIHKNFKCWGGPAHKDSDPFTLFESSCFSQDSIFIGDGFETGLYAYKYDLVKGKKKLSLPRFFNLYEERYLDASAGGNAREGDAGDFSCHDGFTDLQGLRWKTSFCARRYTRFPALYDAHLYMALDAPEGTGVIVTLVLQGVTKKNATDFVARFISEVHPKDVTEIEGAVAP